MEDGGKASRYVSALYEARCKEQWREIPELARKVEKHAPARSCFTLAARSTALVLGRPVTVTYKEAEERYGEVLLAAARETQDTGDALDASVAKAILYYGNNLYDLVLQQVAETTAELRPPNGGVGREAWLAVCVLQKVLVKGLSFEHSGDNAGANTTYRSVLSYLAKVVEVKNPCYALRRAAEELTTHVCLYFSTCTTSESASMGEAMAAYHVLSKLLEYQKGQFVAHRGVFTGETSRQLWRVYYTALSQVIMDGLAYYPSSLDRDHDTIEHKKLLGDGEFTTARKQQYIDLKKVEQSYETVLLNETQFPKANEVNEEVKAWIELAMRNWRVLCGPTWADEELGTGGKAGLGRNILDILYRAQMKTFHSTQILRHLVAVHAYLADFDLAMRAFDTYVGILTKGKARTKKTGSAGLDLDNDNVALGLAADMVRLACQYGPESGAEKALHIGVMIQQWLERGVPDVALVAELPTMKDLAPLHEPATDSAYSEEVLERAYRSIGISQATWARYTLDPEIRQALQDQAVQNLRTSLRYKRINSDDSETYFALAAVLAEKRDPSQALGIVLRVLKSSETAHRGTKPVANDVDQTLTVEDSNHFQASANIHTLRMHHLHILLLASAENYESANTACNDALASVIEEAASSPSAYASDGTSAPLKQRISQRSGLHDRQTAIELKMTQISLLGVCTNTEKAINSSNELMTLYVRLLGPVKVKKAHLVPQQPPVPPKSSSGTIKSILNRSRRHHRGLFNGVSSADNSTSPSAINSARHSRPTTVTNGPTINVIHESDNEKADIAPPVPNLHEQSTNSSPGHDRGKLSTPRHNGKPVRSFGSLRSNNSSTRLRLKLHNDADKVTKSADQTSAKASQPNGVGEQMGGEQDLEPIPHNMPYTKLSPPAKHDEQPPKQDTRLPVTPPSIVDNYGPQPTFLDLQQSKFSISLLVKIWLFIANLYIEATLHTEAAEAIDEAFDLVEALEFEVSQTDSSLRAFQDRGWGGGKTVEDLWADLCAAKGELFQAQDRPYDAMQIFEQGLIHSINHTSCIVGLGTILLDIYEQEISSEKADPTALISLYPPAQSAAHSSATKQSTFTAETFALYRLGYRDRAYALLSSVVGTYEGHAEPRAWLTLARAYELSGQVEEAKAALWRVVELEDTASVRPWNEVLGVGGFVLR